MSLKTLSIRLMNFGLLIVLPAIYGCKGGGSEASSPSNNFAASIQTDPNLGDFSSVSHLADLPPDAGGGALASIHNPEPATMLLLGSGMAAMAYVKNKKKFIK